MTTNTTGLIQSLMNQPMYQQMILDARTAGADKRAVGAGREALGQAVAGESRKLQKLDEIGDELATRRQKLGFAKSMAAKQNALAREKFEMQKESDKLAYTLGGISTVATGFGMYGDWRDRGKADERHREYMDLLRSGNRNQDYFDTYGLGWQDY